MDLNISKYSTLGRCEGHWHSELGSADSVGVGSGLSSLDGAIHRCHCDRVTLPPPQAAADKLDVKIREK